MLRAPFRLSAALAAAGLAGCAALLPRAELATQESWRDYDAAQGAIEKIVPMRTTRDDLHVEGIEPRRNPAITILTYSDVVQRFAGAPIGHDHLDAGVRKCLTAGKACSGYAILVRRTARKRVGNFWLDSLNFYRETEIVGWSFNALILLVDDVVVYTLHGGQPRLHEREVTRNPLGPLQGWGQQVGPNVFD